MQLDSLTGTVQSRSVALEFYRNVTEETDVHSVNYCLSRPPLLWREWATEIRQHALATETREAKKTMLNNFQINQQSLKTSAA